MNKIKVGVLQPKVLPELNSNLIKIKAGIESLAKQGAELVVLPELQNGPYFCQCEDVNNFDLAENIPGNSTKFYGEIAKATTIIIVTTLLLASVSSCRIAWYSATAAFW